MSAANVPVVDEFATLDQVSTRKVLSATEDFSTSVEVKGLRVNVVVRGRGRPLLLVGGIGANVEMCEPFAEAMRHTRLIMFDMPGCGGSSTPVRPISFAGLASLIEGLLDTLGHEHVDVLGVSMGGGVAQQLARQAPGRVRRLGTTCRP